MSNRLKSRHSIASGGLSSLRLTSNLAAAVFSGLGHAPLPGMFKWDPAKFEEELRIARRMRRKQKFIGCFKKLLAFLFSQVGLAGTVIFYSLIGGLMFQHIEREQEIADKQRFSELKYKHINNTLDFFIQQLEQLDYDIRLPDDDIVTDPTTPSTSATTTTTKTSTSTAAATTTTTTTSIKNRTKTNRTVLSKALSANRSTTKRTTTTTPTIAAATTEATRDIRERLLAEGSEILLRYFSDFQSEVTDAVKSGGWDGKDEVGEAYLQWSFPGALLYAVTVITTIGYGHIAPKTKVGRLLTIGYALIGIPLTFLYLSNIGNFLGESLKKICCGVCCCMQCKRRKDREILRLRRKQRFLTARQELSMTTGDQYDPMDGSEDFHGDGLQEVITEKESLLYPTDKPDPEYAALQRPPSSTNTSISLSSSDRAALFVSMKNEENHRQTSPLISHDHGPENQVKFGCSVTITPPEDDKLRMTARERKHRPSLTVEGSRFSPTTIQEEFHAEESSPSKVEREGTMKSSTKKSRGTSKKKKRTTSMNLSLTKRFEELEETAILSDDYHSPAEEIKETSILDDLKEADPPPVRTHDFHGRVSTVMTAPKAHNTGVAVERKTCIKFDTGKHSSSKHKVKKTLFTLDDDDDDDTRRFASLEMLPLASSPVERTKRMTRANTEDVQEETFLKRVETAPVGTGLISNSSVEASKKSSSSKRNLRKTSPPAKSKSIKESEDKDSKIAASSLVIGHGSKKHSHSFNEKLKTKRKSQTEFELSSNSLRRIHTVPLHSTRERSKREPKSSSTQKKSNDSEKSQKRSKSKKKQTLQNSDRYRSDYDMIRAFNSYSRATGNYLLPPSLRARYAGRARNASFSQDVINSALKNTERKILTNQPPLSFQNDKTGEAIPGLRTRPASVIGLKSLTDLRNQVAIQNRPHRSDHISSAVSYIMLQSAAEANRGEREEHGNPHLGGNTFPAVASPSDLFLQDNPLLDFDDEDLKDQSHDHKVPIYVCLIIITGYISGGAMLFCTWEKWDYIASSYFCFITLSTIGFGDIVPGTDVNKWASHEKLVLCTLWLALGLSLLAMCFNLMQESVKERFRKFGQRIGLLKSQDGPI